MKDAAGMTRADVAKLSLREEFDLARGRYLHVQELMRDAQLQISDGVWEYGGGSTLPVTGGGGGVNGGLAGADDANSYYYGTTRIIQPAGAEGSVSDLEPMRKYFPSKGWEIRDRKTPGGYDIRGLTGDGYVVAYEVQDSGRYNITVDSELFWSSDADALFTAIGDRDPHYTAQYMKVGEIEPFPDWSAPQTPFSIEK